MTEITALLSLLLNHSSYISSPTPPRLRHRPLAAFLVFIIILFISLPSPWGAVFVCVGCTVLHKSCMLMQQRAAEHYSEWTNFRSAWPRFITAHKPKVSGGRWRGESVPCSTRIIYHPAPVCSASLFPFPLSLFCLGTVHMLYSTYTVIYLSLFVSSPRLLITSLSIFISFPHIHV